MLFHVKGDEVFKDHGPKTLLNAVHNALKDHEMKNGIYKVMGKVLAFEEGTAYGTTHFDELNASALQTALIQNAGRYCERFASDLICTLSDLEPFIRNKPVTCSVDNRVKNPEEWVIGVGLREDGVDHNDFILNRLKESRRPSFSGKDALHNAFVNVNQTYRKVLAIYITENRYEWQDEYVKLEIYVIDITHDFSRIDPMDESDD